MNFDVNDYQKYLSSLTIPALRAEQKILEFTASHESRILHHIKTHLDAGVKGADVFAEQNLTEYKQQAGRTTLKLEAFSDELDRRNDEVLTKEEEPLHTQVRLLRVLANELNTIEIKGEEEPLHTQVRFLRALTNELNTIEIKGENN